MSLGIAAGALTVLVSDETWAVGLPFQCLVPWRRLSFSLLERAFYSEVGGAPDLHRLNQVSPSMLVRMQRLANRYRRDLVWNMEGSRVGENVLLTAALRCLPTHVTRDAERSVRIAASLRQVRQVCAFADVSAACRQPDSENCEGCETGGVAAATPLEYCCADSCPSCNRTRDRCLSVRAVRGSPAVNGPDRQRIHESYMGRKEDDMPSTLKRWRKSVGRNPDGLPAKLIGV